VERPCDEEEEGAGTDVSERVRCEDKDVRSETSEERVEVVVRLG
jgi:hypothetical protein